MPGMKLEAFMGLVPRASPRLLPPMAATAARNTKLLNGEVRGFRSLREEADFSAGTVTPVRRAVRVVDNAGIDPDTWLTFDSRDVDVVRSPIVNDGFDRYFWAGDGKPMMNSYARIANGDPAYLLGIPIPQNAPSVAPPAGSDETRAYVYTFESSFGEEGQPSPPTVVTGNAGTWELTGIDTTVPDSAQRDITKVNIYRTVTGATSSNFYFVATINFGVAAYSDNEATSAVASNPLLESTTWAEPPTNLEGFVVMPNGYLVGWVGRRLVFSEAYRPHAWPAEYELSTEFPIVGLVVWGSTLVIGTKSQPYFGQGTSPLSFTMQKLDAVEPCLSRRGMVATTAGAYYPSINGLILANSSGAKVITQDILTKEEWATYQPQNIYAAQLGLQYLAFVSDSFGFIFNPTEPQTKLVELDNFSDVDGIETDRYSGDVLILSNDRAQNWDPVNSERLQWRWQSKQYQFDEPMNFGAVRLNFKTGADDITGDIGAYYGAYNVSLFAAVPSGNAPVAGDTFWDDVIYLGKYEGANNATAYTELSTFAQTHTFYGNAEISTTQSNQGSSSVSFDGTGDGIQASDPTDTQLGTEDEVTVEGFVYLNALPAGAGTDWQLVNQAQQDVNGFEVRFGNLNGTLYQVEARFGFGNTPTGVMAAPSTGAWYYFSAQRRINGPDHYVDIFWGLASGGTATRLSQTLSNNNPSNIAGVPITIGAWDNATSQVFTQVLNGYVDDVRITKAARHGNVSSVTIPSDYPLTAPTSGIEQRGLNTLNGHVLGGSPAQARGLVPSWTEPETHQPLGGSLLYPENLLSFQTLAIRMIVKTGPDNVVRFDKVIYNEDIVRLPTGFKHDLWQFDFYGNTDLYSVQIGTTPRALKQV